MLKVDEGAVQENKSQGKKKSCLIFNGNLFQSATEKSWFWVF